MNPLNSLKPQRKSRMADRLPNLIQSLTGFRLQLVSVPALGLIAGLTLLGEAPAYGQAAGDIQVRTQFTPILLPQGGNGSLTLTISNNAAIPLGNVRLDKTLPSGLRLRGTTATSNVCGLTLDLSNRGRLQITNGTLPAAGECVLVLPIEARRITGQTTSGNVPVTLTIAGGTMPNGELKAGTGSNTAPSSGTITLGQLGNIAHSMTLAPTPIPGGGRTRFTMAIPNGTGRDLTNATFTNGFTIPAGFTLAPGLPNNTCGGALTVTGNPLQVKLTGGTIPAAGCEFSFELIGPVTEATYGPVTWAAGDLVTDLEVSNNAGTSNALAVETGLKITQAFDRASVFINEPSILTITIRNASNTAIANAGLQSVITGATRNQLRVVPGSLGGTCTPGSVNYTAATGTLAFTGVDVPGATLTPAAAAKIEECTITVQVQADNQGIGTYTSTIANGQLINQVNGTPNANLSITDLEVANGNGVGLGFAFGPGVGGPFGSYEVAASNRSLMRITLSNNAGETLTGVGIGNTGIRLDAGLRLATSNTVSNTCGGTVTAPAGGPGPITLTGGTIPRRGSCFIDVEVVSDASKLDDGYGASAAAGVVSTALVIGQPARTYTNAAAGPGPNYLEVTDYLNILPSMAATISAPNADARVRLRLTNARDQARSQLQLRYRLPFRIAGVPDFEAGPGCGIANPATAFRVVEVTPGTFELQLDNIQIPAKGTNPTILGNGQDGICDLAFDVQAPTATGVATVPVPAGVLRTADGLDQNRTARNATFNVVPLTLTLDQTIINEEIDDAVEAIDRIRGGEPAILTVTLTNPGNPVPLTNITFTDVLENVNARIFPGGTATTTCTGTAGSPATVTLNERTKTFGLSGANLASGQSCSLRVPVTTLAVDLLNNIIPIESAVSAEGAKSIRDEDQVFVRANLGLVKTIVPASVAAGQPARMTITILNATNAAPTDVTLTDNFPLGLVIADTPDLQTTDCPATAVSAPAGANVLRVRNGSLNANSTCQISVNVTSLVPQGAPGYVNEIPAGGLSAEGGVRANPKPARASLLVTGTTVQRPGLRLVKRATALTPAGATAPIDLTPISVDDSGSFDNAPGWPGTLTTAGISTYLKGATDTAQLDLPGKQSLTSGTEVEYSGYYLSNGTVGTNNTKLCDFIPKDTTYVPGSLVWVKGDGTSTAVADATGFLPTTATFPAACAGTNNSKGAVVVDLGNLANTGTGSYGHFKFKVKID
jgi:uncharacterized repeat protein (TIGR01451 family)